MADLTAAVNDGDSTDTESNTDDSGTSIPEVFANIGAAMGRVEQFFDEYGEESIEGLTALAEQIEAEGLDVIVPAEDYRHSNGINRIRYNWGFARGGDFLSAWFKNFYGPSDGSEEGTHNYIQAVARDAGVNLAWYKVMFPEPHDDYSEDSVQVTDYDELGLPNDDDLPDSNIFVPRWYAERFADSVNDDGVPLPPAENSGEYGGSSDDVPDPSEYTVDDLREVVADIDDSTVLVRMNEREKDRKGRKTAREVIERRLTNVSTDDDGDDDADPIAALAESKGLSDEETAALRALLA